MIKHIITTNDNGDIVYTCNQACEVTQEKVALNPNDATCKNCIRLNNKIIEDGSKKALVILDGTEVKN